MLLSLKCNVQILGSISLLNFLAACLQKTSHFLRSSDFTGKRKYSRSGLFFIPLQEQATAQYLFTWKKTAKKPQNTGRFPVDLAKAHGFAYNVSSHFSRCIPWSLASLRGFLHQSLALKYIEIGLFFTCGDRVFLTGGNP